jgi:two-component system, NarL family, nitrate/nitrite response regulator NarL
MLCMEPLTQPVALETSGERIRLILLNDHVLLRESLARLLASETEFELVAQCSTTAEALKFLSEVPVDVVIVDLSLAKEFMDSARKADYRAKALVVAREMDTPSSAVILKQGASGIFRESDSSSRLLQAIRFVASGEAWVDQKVVQLLADLYPHYENRWLGKLSEKEQTVLNGVVAGLSNRSIAVQINASESSVKATLQLLFNKAGVRKRSQLVRIALEGLPVDSAEVNEEAGRAH